MVWPGPVFGIVVLGCVVPVVVFDCVVDELVDCELEVLVGLVGVPVEALDPLFDFAA